MTNIDILLIAILSILIIYGLYKGFISIIIPFKAIIITLILAPILYNHLSKYFNHSIILKIITIISAYSIIRIILSKVEKSFKKILEIIFLSWIDRILGASILIFIASIIIYFSSITIINIFPEYQNLIKESRIITYIILIFKDYNNIIV